MSFNGGAYHGYWKDDKMDGRGVLKYASGAKYTGNFSMGKPRKSEVKA